MANGFLAIVGVVTVGSGSSYAAICATPGISEKRRLILAGGACADRPEFAAAVRREGAALPISGDDVGATLGVTCPTNGEASCEASAIGMTALFAMVSFDWADAGVVDRVTGVNSPKGLCTADGVSARIERVSSRWDLGSVEMAGLIAAEGMLPVCLVLC